MPLRNLSFVIVEKNGFFSHDMQEGLRAACADCQVDIFVDPVAAVSGMRWNPERTTVVVTSYPVDRVIESGLALLADERGAAMVISAHADGAEHAAHRGWHLLPAPFTSEALTDLVLRFRGGLRNTDAA